MTTLQDMAARHTRLDRAIKKLGDKMPEGARMWVECRRRIALYRYPCTERTTGWKKYRTPDNCPFEETCTGDMAHNAIEALILSAARTKAMLENPTFVFKDPTERELPIIDGIERMTESGRCWVVV